MLAIVLSRRDFREFDQILSLFTDEKGKVEILARGIKKIISKQSAHAEPFSLVDLDIVKGKEIDHLTGIQALNIFLLVRSDLNKSMMASFVVSATDKLIEVGMKDEKIFNLLKNWLEFINSEFVEFNSILVDGYMVKLLNCLGFDITCAEKIPSEMIENLNMLANGDWSSISSIKTTDSKLHNFIYKFVLYHSDKKVADWKILTL